ncbi:MAG TPA: DUF4235 domain-containing protein [Solirubrobacterales bacterium]|nr:DUF4235 domain-containing protein [Solirubrobacterales bacterium]
MKVLFAPISIGAGLLAGFLAQKLFERLWAVIDDEEPPEPDNRVVSVPKLVLALAIEGAVFRLVKGLTDRGARKGFATVIGAWPGDDPAREED